jgi:hypothetical protein
MKCLLSTFFGKIFLSVPLLVLSTVAHAQAIGFVGLFFEAATGYQEMTAKVHDVKINNLSFGRADREQKITGVPFAVNIGYSAALSQAAGLGARFEYNPKSGRIALSIIPSLAMTEIQQVYGKLGWAYMETTVDALLPGLAVSSQTAYLSGPLVGIGSKLLLTDNVYVFIELTYYKYADLSLSAKNGPINVSGKTSSSAQNALIGLGYRF